MNHSCTVNQSARVMDILTIAMIKHAVSKEVENTTTMQQACEGFKDALGWAWLTKDFESLALSQCAQFFRLHWQTHGHWTTVDSRLKHSREENSRAEKRRAEQVHFHVLMTLFLFIVDDSRMIQAKILLCTTFWRWEFKVDDDCFEGDDDKDGKKWQWIFHTVPWTIDKFACALFDALTNFYFFSLFSPPTHKPGLKCLI